MAGVTQIINSNLLFQHNIPKKRPYKYRKLNQAPSRSVRLYSLVTPAILTLTPVRVLKKLKISESYIDSIAMLIRYAKQ